LRYHANGNPKLKEIAMQRLTAALTSFLIAGFWANSAFATLAPFGETGPNPVTPAPEIDGRAGLAAIVLLVSLGAVAYRKLQKQ
jgi:hypothetical protein